MKNLEKILIIAILFWINFIKACDACSLQQPKITRNLTHGTGPEGRFDWIIVSVFATITLFTLIFSLKFLINPKEKNEDHIKRQILNS